MPISKARKKRPALIPPTNRREWRGKGHGRASRQQETLRPRLCAQQKAYPACACWYDSSSPRRRELRTPYFAGLQHAVNRNERWGPVESDLIRGVFFFLIRCCTASRQKHFGVCIGAVAGIIILSYNDEWAPNNPVCLLSRVLWLFLSYGNLSSEVTRVNTDDRVHNKYVNLKKVVRVNSSHIV